MRTYQTKQNKGGLPDSITVLRYGAGEFNSLAVEAAAAVSSSGQTPAPADGTGEVSDQLGKALAIYGAGGAGYHKDTGAVNAYVLNPVAPRKSPPAYFDGFTISFAPGTDNTGAATVNVATLGVKDIVDLTGAPLAGGEITGNVEIRYDSVLGAFILLTVAGGGIGFDTLPVGYEYATLYPDMYDTLLATGKWALQGGQVYVQTAFPELYAAIGDSHSTAAQISAGNFAVADERGLFKRSWDNGAGIDPDAATRTARPDLVGGDKIGTTQADAFQGHRMDRNIAGLTETVVVVGGTFSQALIGSATAAEHPTTTGDPVTDGTNGTPRIATETRSKNMAEARLIKILP